MSLQEVLEVQKNLKKLLDRVLSVSTAKQEALVKNESAILTEIICNEEKVLTDLRRAETERNALIRTYLEEQGLDKNMRKLPKLSELVAEKFPQETVDKIKQLENRMKNVALKIDRVNKQNLFLIQHLRTVLNEVMFALIGHNRKSYLDRKV